jgi:hypothetical protein
MNGVCMGSRDEPRLWGLYRSIVLLWQPSKVNKNWNRSVREHRGVHGGGLFDNEPPSVCAAHDTTAAGCCATQAVWKMQSLALVKLFRITKTAGC